MILSHLPVHYVQDHVEGYLELSAKTKTYFTTAVALWDADFYVKVDDDVHVNIGKQLISFPFSVLMLINYMLLLWTNVVSRWDRIKYTKLRITYYG